MTNLSYFLRSLFQSSPPPTINKQSNEYLYKRGANPGFENASSQKITFPGGNPTTKPVSGTAKPTTTAKEPPKSSSVASSPSLTTPTTPTPTNILPTNTNDTLMTVTPNITASPSSTSTNSTSADQSGSSGGLSGGAIGAIVAVVLIVIGGIAAFFIMRRQRRKKIEMKASAGAMRDPYNEGFTTFPPPPPPSMSYYNNNNNNNNNNQNNQYHPTINTNMSPTAAGSAHQQALTSPTSNSYPYPNPTSPAAAYPMTSPTTSSYPMTSPTLNSPAMAYTTTAPPTLTTVPAVINTNNNNNINTSTPPPPPPSQQQQQQQQPGDIWQQPPLGTFIVVSTYTPTLSDEIDVQPNDQVQIFEEYDDGWCLGVNLTRGQTKGVFPKHCVTPDVSQQQQQQQQQIQQASQLQQANPSSASLAVSDNNNSTVGKRVSSLIMDSSPVAN